jgi:hypothetical protein
MVWSSALAADVNATDEVIRLTVPFTPRRSTNYLTIEQEVVEVRGGSDSLYVLRGVMGSEPVAHSAGVAISRYGVYGTDAPASGGTAAHPNLATHQTLGLATTAALNAHLSDGDPHVLYALDADLVNHEAAGHVHTHGTASHGHAFVDLAGAAAAVHVHDYSATGHTHGTAAHSHADADLPAGLARDSEVTSAIETHAATPHGGSLPAGLIVMWGGLVANIPAGWALCNGQNGTPDLRGRFIKGTGSDPGATGGTASHVHADHAALTHSGAAVADHTFTQPTAAGEAAHTHTYTQVPNHVHVQSVNSAATGALSGYTADTSTNTAVASGYSTQNPTGGVATGTASAGSSHTHTLSGGSVTAHVVTQPSQHAAQAHAAADSEPPYYALCFIQKT